MVGEMKVYKGKTYIADNIGWKIGRSEKSKIVKKLAPLSHCPDDGTKLVPVGIGLPPKPYLYCKKCDRLYNSKKDFELGKEGNPYPKMKDF